MSYNHEEEEFHTSCGFSKEQVETIIDKANSIAKGVLQEGGPMSKIVEKQEKELSAKELSFLLNMVQRDFAELRSMLASMAKTTP